jgi:hypothetical protein
MTTLILLTPHPGDLDYDLDQASNFSLKNDKVLMIKLQLIQEMCLEKSG